MKRLFLASLLTILLTGCAIVPVGYGRYGVIVDGPPAYNNKYPHRYGGYGSSYGYGRYGHGGPTRWVPGYQRWVCEGPPPNQKCYWTWEPAHYE